MEIIRGWHNLKNCKDTVVTLGNFDGVHRGHQTLLTTLKNLGQQAGLPTTVVLFEPHPKAFFNPANAPLLITPLHEKLRLLADFGIDRVVCLAFNQRLSQLPAEQFVKDLLVRDLQAKHILVGDDFCFGYQRQGNITLLTQLGVTQGFMVTSLSAYCSDNQRISSSLIRRALAEGDCEVAEQLLGRPYHIAGWVRHGDKRGRTLGFPTANIAVKQHQLAIPYGIYVVAVTGITGKLLFGVASLGVRPTLEVAPVLWLEVHLFDFHGSLYDQKMGVHFLHKLRDELTFPTIATMVEQMHRDVAAARAFIATNTTGKSMELADELSNKAL